MKPIYALLYRKSVEKDLRKLSTVQRKQIVEKIFTLCRDPYPPGSAKLQGGANLYRVRSGDYRIIYQVRNRELIILIVKVGHRKEVYRDK